jgi:hypothetical protein
VENVLSLFSTAESAKAIAKKMFPEVAQLLLAHAYQASELNAAPHFLQTEVCFWFLARLHINVLS